MFEDKTVELDQRFNGQGLRYDVFICAVYRMLLAIFRFWQKMAPMVNRRLDERGDNTAMRAVPTVCVELQQSALNTHHTNDNKLLSHDLVIYRRIDAKNTCTDQMS